MAKPQLQLDEFDHRLLDLLQRDAARTLTRTIINIKPEHIDAWLQSRCL